MLVRLRVAVLTQAFDININRFNMVQLQYLFGKLRFYFMYAGYLAARGAVQVCMLVCVR